MALIKSKKGLFMTVLVLILFLLILSELISFALLDINYNTLDQSIAVGSSSVNYGKVFGASATQFANASLGTALKTLANYEFNSSLRGNNLISNTSQYISYLMTNGMLPNVAAGTIPANFLTKSMGNFTLASYNAVIANSLQLGGISIKVNETMPSIYQSSPYSLSVGYVENVALNSTSGRFTYQIPINATISLNNTPDLFYYQQGIARTIRFSPTSNLTSLIGSINASNGNFLATAYGPVYNVPTGAGGLTCANLATMISANMPAFSFAPYNQMLILATSNAIGITQGASASQCADQYGGLITYNVNSVALPPAIPWLSYSSSTSFLGNLKNGQQVLIIGNTLSTYNIQNLISMAGDGDYFASPLAPSYLDGVQGSLSKQDPNGIFTLSSYNTQAANFSRSIQFSNIYLGSNAIIKPTGSMTFTVWANPESASCASNSCYILSSGAQTSSTGYYVVFVSPNQIEAGIKTATEKADATPTLSYPINQWYFIAGSYNSTSNIFNLYINGNDVSQIAGTSGSWSNTVPTVYIGRPNNAANYYFNGQIAGVQVYDTSLSSQQIYQLYQEGILGIPPSNSGLVGWWPLNGNANDYSGFGNNGVPTNTPYFLPSNYLRDSMLSTTIPTQLSAIPGLLNCNSNSQCSNGLLPHAYLGYYPLEIQQSSLQVAGINKSLSCYYCSYIGIGNIGVSGDWTASLWAKVATTSPSVQIPIGFGGYNTIFMAISPSEDWGFISQPDYLYGNVISPNVWYNLVVTKSGTTYTLYTSGQSSNSFSANSISISDLRIGQRSADQGIGFIGSVANLQIYSSALSAKQVTQLYNEGISGLPLGVNALAGWWPLNGNANDYSGYSRNGIPYNTIFNSFSGTYNSPGLSTVSTAANEWQTIGIPRSGG